MRAGAGGLDAQAFATRLVRMYLRYAHRSQTPHELLHTDPGEAGLRTATVSVQPRAGQRWALEHGVHRITHLSEIGSGRGRRQTSFAAVEVLEEPAPAQIAPIGKNDIRIDLFRGSGPGGQHRNKVESAVRITHIETGITAMCASARSQHANREAAMRVLAARLAQREREALDSARDEARRQRAPAAFGHHIRTYRMERDTIHDTAQGVRIAKANAVLDGDLARLWRALGTKRK